MYRETREFIKYSSGHNNSNNGKIRECDGHFEMEKAGQGSRYIQAPTFPWIIRGRNS